MVNNSVNTKEKVEWSGHLISNQGDLLNMLYILLQLPCSFVDKNSLRIRLYFVNKLQSAAFNFYEDS